MDLYTVGSSAVYLVNEQTDLKRQKYSGYMIIERDAEDKPSNVSSIIQTVTYCNNALGLVSTQK